MPKYRWTETIVTEVEADTLTEAEDIRDNGGGEVVYNYISGAHTEDGVPYQLEGE